MYGEIIKDFRDRNELTQKQVANILGISNTLYCDYENENQIMPIKYLNILVNYFNSSIDYFFGLTDKDRYMNIKENIDTKISGERIRTLRKDNKLTQVKLAKILNIGNGTIAEYERGTYIVSTHILYTMCKKYHISADYLLGKIDEPKYLL